MGELEIVHTGLDFGEGPRWHDGLLWYSDFYRHGVFTLDADGTETRRHTVAGRPSGLGWLPDGRLLVTSMTDRVVLREHDGGLEVHAELADLVDGHVNDMVVGPDGTAWVGSFGFDLEAGEAPRTTVLVRVGIDGTASVAADGLGFPNGSVMPPDGSTLIVGETFAHRYSAFTVTAEGDLVDRRVWAEVDGMFPDGCCLDAEGAIWTADPVNRCVRRLREGGEVTHRVDTELSAVACMLGGDDRRTLYVLSSPGTHPDEVAGVGGGRIEAMRVDVEGWGLP